MLCARAFLAAILATSVVAAGEARKQSSEGPPPPPPSRPICSAAFGASSPGGADTVIGEGYEALVGQPVRFSVKSFPNVPCQFLWIYGDGTTSSDFISTSHTYSSPGNYTVAAMATMTGTSIRNSYALILHIVQSITVPHVACVGAGVIGDWDTALTLVNPSDSPMPYVITYDPDLSPGSAGCPDVNAGCGLSSGIIASESFVEVGSLNIREHPTPAPGVLYVAGATLGSIPAVSAMIFEGGRCGRSASLPIVGPLDTLYDNSPIMFGGAEISPCAHSNLLLIPMPGSSDPVEAGVLVEDGASTRIQNENVSGAPGQAIFVNLGDPFLGVSADAALVTVSPVSGGPFAAIVTVVGSEGIRVLTPARNPLSNIP